MPLGFGVGFLRLGSRTKNGHSASLPMSGKRVMERIANLHIERLPEGVYLATSEDVPGLVAQGRTIAETLEIARDVAKKLLEAQRERPGRIELAAARETFDYPLIVAD